MAKPALTLTEKRPCPECNSTNIYKYYDDYGQHFDNACRDCGERFDVEYKED